MVTSNDVKNIIVQILTNNFFELLITIYFSATPPEQNTLISKSICKACTKMFFIKKILYKWFELQLFIFWKPVPAQSSFVSIINNYWMRFLWYL